MEHGKNDCNYKNLKLMILWGKFMETRGADDEQNQRNKRNNRLSFRGKGNKVTS